MILIVNINILFPLNIPRGWYIDIYMFKDFREEYIQVNKGKLFCRIGGDGAPLLLLHGYPQTHMM